MMESVLEFGPGRRLLGILTRPPIDATARDAAFVITNSGIIHHVGANRLHVRLARFLARQGYPCLRYDLPGVGDSENPVGAPARQTEINIRATANALDALQAAGVAERFVMLGLCSGAQHSFEVVCSDSRVVGAVIIDPTMLFATRRHRVNVMLKTAARRLNPRSMWRLVTGRYHIVRRLTERETTVAGGHNGLPGADSIREQASAALQHLVQRNVRILMVLTGHSHDAYSYDRQMFDAFPEVSALPELMRIRRRPQSSHTFSDEADREFLEHTVVEWLGTTPFAESADLVGR